MTGPRRPRAWVAAVRDGRPPAPTVLVLGGFLTSPPLYRGLVRALRARGVADVVVGPVWTPDWLLAALRGLGPVLTRSGRALVAAGDRSERVSGGAPVLVVGHSAGGMSGRLLTSPVPFAARRLGAAGRIGALVTLGTPHVVAPAGSHGNRVSGAASAFAASELPGATFAPTTGYLAVASRAFRARPGSRGAERCIRWCYEGLLPVPPGPDETIEGDGLVPLACALIPGAPSLVLDEAAHGQVAWGRPWYGDEPHVAAWWPAALAAWHAALRARVERLDGVADRADERPDGVR